MDYQKELELATDVSVDDKADFAKLAAMQRDIAVAGSAEDFIRHPFFKAFENQMNEMIGDAKGAILKVTTIEELKAYQAGIAAIGELKRWLNSKVIAGRVAKQAIEIYEQDTETMNAVIQEAVDKAQA